MLKALLASACALALSGCVSTEDLSPETREALAKALAEKIPHCSGDVQIDAGLGGLAGIGTGVRNSAQLHCPGQPYNAP